METIVKNGALYTKETDRMIMNDTVVLCTIDDEYSTKGPSLNEVINDLLAQRNKLNAAHPEWHEFPTHHECWLDDGKLVCTFARYATDEEIDLQLKRKEARKESRLKSLHETYMALIKDYPELARQVTLAIPI